METMAKLRGYPHLVRRLARAPSVIAIKSGAARAYIHWSTALKHTQKVIKIMKFHSSITQAAFQSPIGPMTLAATRNGLAGVWFDGQRHLPKQLATPSSWPVDASNSILKQAALQLAEYFAGKRREFELQLDLSGGTAFQQTVWQALLTIKPGQTISYGSISRAIGNPAAVRAVGSAVGRNPISIIVPCHRVMGADGSLTGYAGGLGRKTELLKLEGASGRPESVLKSALELNLL